MHITEPMAQSPQALAGVRKVYGLPRGDTDKTLTSFPGCPEWLSPFLFSQNKPQPSQDSFISVY